MGRVCSGWVLRPDPEAAERGKGPERQAHTASTDKPPRTARDQEPAQGGKRLRKGSVEKTEPAFNENTYAANLGR